MDLLLIDHFLDEFDAKHPEVSVKARDSPKAIAKLRKQVRKTKEILSANQEAPLSVEGMHEDVDFRSTVTRTTFYELAEKKGLWDRATAPLQAIVDLLPDFNLTLSDVEVVEAIGGATRVPGVKNGASRRRSGRAGRWTCTWTRTRPSPWAPGLFAANMSTTFRMRKFGAADAAPYAVRGGRPRPDQARRAQAVAAAAQAVPRAPHRVRPERDGGPSRSPCTTTTRAGPRLPPGDRRADKVAEFADRRRARRR